MRSQLRIRRSTGVSCGGSHNPAQDACHSIVVKNITRDKKIPNANEALNMILPQSGCERNKPCSQNFTCPKCGCIDIPVIEHGRFGPHNAKSSCRSCGAFVKWIGTKAYSNIPEPLRVERRWILGHVEAGRKPPYSVHTLHTGRMCDDTDPASWAFCDEAISALETIRTNTTNTGGQGWGLGFFFTADLGMTFLDLDYCRNPATGDIESWGQRLIERFRSYTELSRSGRGVHIIIRGTKPGPKCKYYLPCGARRVELYDQNQYLWITGHHLPGTPTTIEYRQQEITDLYRAMWPPSPAPPVNDVNASHTPPSPESLDDATLLSIMLRARNGPEIRKLWEGNTSGYRSPSEADLAMCSHLAFWCRKDAGRMDRLFRQSGLMRDKWDRQSYRTATINSAIRATRRVFGA